MEIGMRVQPFRWNWGWEASAVLLGGMPYPKMANQNKKTKRRIHVAARKHSGGCIKDMLNHLCVEWDIVVPVWPEHMRPAPMNIPYISPLPSPMVDREFFEILPHGPCCLERPY